MQDLGALDVESLNFSIRGYPVGLVGLVLVWFWSGFGLVWFGWSGFGLVGLVLVWLVWFWSGRHGDPLMEDLGVSDVQNPMLLSGDPRLVWFWSGLAQSGFGLVARGSPDRRFEGFGRRKHQFFYQGIPG
jgi:hypothetical protein